MTDDGRQVAKSSSEAPDHPQETIIYMAKHPDGLSGPDNMIQAKGSKENRSSGEAAVKKYRTMY